MTEPQQPSESTSPASQPQASDPDREYLELSQSLRRLAICLADPASADDIVQEAWLAALDSPPGRIRDLNAWLRQVLRRIASRDQRRQLRRREVELLAATQETLAPERSPAELRSTRELLRQAVQDLSEPLREVMRLRFFEERSVAEIAAELGRPQATVRTQMRRGLIELRATLDRKHDGDRLAWSTLLLQAAQADLEAEPAAALGASPTFALGSGRALLALVLLAAPVLLWWRPWSVAPPGDPAVDASTEASAGAAAEAGALADASRPGEQRVDAGPPQPASATEIAPGTELQPPGAVPTRTLEVVLRLANGALSQDVEVELYAPLNERLGVYRSGDDGRLRIELRADQLAGPPTVYGEHPGVGVVARARGEAWTYRYQLPIPPEGYRLELESPGADQTIRGTVLDASNRPLEGATVEMVGETLARPLTAEGIAYMILRRSDTTDAEGRYALFGNRIEEHSLRVTAPGWATQLLTLDSDEREVVQDVVLEQGARVVGRVRRADGSPAALAQVWQPPPISGNGARANASTRADAQGVFELGGLDAGTLLLFACDAEDESLFAHAALETITGQAVAWDPTLVPTTGVRVAVQEETGEPVPHAGTALLMTGEPGWGEFRHADEEGRAHFPHVPEGRLLVGVKRSFNAPSMGEIRAGAVISPEPFVVVLPPRPAALASLGGSVLDAHGRPFPGARVVGDQSGPVFDQELDELDGSFRIESILPGPCAVSVLAPGRGAIELGVRELLPGEHNLLEPVRAARPGTVRIEWGAVRPTPEAPWLLQAHVAEGFLHHFEILELREPLETVELLPGTYVLHDPKSELPPASRRFRVRSGEVSLTRPGP